MKSVKRNTHIFKITIISKTLLQFLYCSSRGAQQGGLQLKLILKTQQNIADMVSDKIEISIQSKTCPVTAGPHSWELGRSLLTRLTNPSYEIYEAINWIFSVNSVKTPKPQVILAASFYCITFQLITSLPLCKQSTISWMERSVPTSHSKNYSGTGDSDSKHKILSSNWPISSNISTKVPRHKHLVFITCQQLSVYPLYRNELGKGNLPYFNKNIKQNHSFFSTICTTWHK